jgi:beta-lactamase regulating signal transducer with metallopeptidase domain
MFDSVNMLVHLIDSALGWKHSLIAASPLIFEAAGAMLATAIWQGAIIAASLTICLKMANRVSAALRFSVWAGGFLAVVALPFMPLVWRESGGPVSQSALSLAVSPARPLLQLDIRWSIGLTLLWAAASIYRAVDLAVHSARLRTLWKSATPVQSDSLSLVKSVRLWGRKTLQVCTTNALDRPSVIGFFAPRILIPEWLFGRLTPGELDQILLHETEHLRRGDDWTNLLQKLSLVFFPLNPVLLWIERRLCLEREMACDEAVIRVTHAPKAYAACLTGLAEHGMQRVAEALSLGAWQRRPELVHRIQSILRRKPALGPLATRSLFAVLALGLGFGSIELGRCPQVIAFTSAPHVDSSRFHAPALRAGMGSQISDATLPGSTHAISLSFSESSTPSIALVKATVSQRTPQRSWTKPAANGMADSELSSSQLSMKASQDMPFSIPSEPGLPNQALPRQELLKADIPHDSSVSVPAQQEQAWIVLTTWEQVDLQDQRPTLIANAQDQATGPVSVQSSQKELEQEVEPAVYRLPQSSSRSVTMTRFILTVLPISSSSTSLTSLPARAGWLVIQL